METPKKRTTRKPSTSPRTTTARTAPRSRVAPPAGAPEPSHEAIANRAYDLFQSSGGGHGRDIEFWLTAERELKGKRRL